MAKTLYRMSLLLAMLPAAIAFSAENLPQARFRGPLTYDFGVTNVQWEAATPEYSYVTFDLYWSYSWRAKWTEPAKTSATGKDMEVENWDAAWVFVKFLPEKDSATAQERNHWLHATLDKDSSNHVMPAGATNTVKWSDDGTRGMGLFIYRDAIGHGANDWKKIKLRWNHGAESTTGLAPGKFDPAKAAVNVHAIAMVYVPEGAFKVGTGSPSGNYQMFADGPDMPAVMNMQNMRSRDQEMGGLTDGSWRGGNSIPFLLDAEWNGPAKEGTRARRIGNAPGELWGTHTYWEVNLGCVAIGPGGALPDEFPTGYEAFYCMKYDLTQGQYVDFLNSLPPDVAAERAFTGPEVGSDASMHRASAKVSLGPQSVFELLEIGGCTIYSSAEIPQIAPADLSAHSETEEVSEDEKRKSREMDQLVGNTLRGQKTDRNAPTTTGRPIYKARLPFRRIPGTTPSDVQAYAVWAGLRPMSQLEGEKAGNGARNPSAPPDWPLPDLQEPIVLLDEGLPTERFLKGYPALGSSVALRAGCRSTPTSDRGTAYATYWGISELDAVQIACEIPVRDRGFRGTHGNGITSPGKPGASFQRTVGVFNDTPADWTKWWTYLGGHFAELRCRLAVSAGNRIQKPAGEPGTGDVKQKPALPIPPVDGRKDDFPRVTNVRIEPGKEFSTVSFDLAWNNSWRAKWTEPAEQNCTGKPLALENWDAAWIFVKFRPRGAHTFSHATLSSNVTHHVKPAGAALEMGLSDDGAKGIGVFIYRDAVGQGANDFKGIKLRWLSGGDQADPATVEPSVHAIPMVYVPSGPFRSKNPVVYYVSDTGLWTPDAYECKLMTIDTPDATRPSGHANHAATSGKDKKPYPHEGPDFPNGYNAFYCMKYAINQGEYALFLDETAGSCDRQAYGRGGNTLHFSMGEGHHEAEVPERPAKDLSDGNIYAFTAWAGLRPPTCLEYEKAGRGPRAVARDEDAWAPGACAPAAGLAQFVPSLARQEPPANRRLIWPSPSYWGIRDLSQSGAIIEWPAIVIEDGRGYTGPHGTGADGRSGRIWPQNWPFYTRGEWYAFGMIQGFPLSQVGIWLLTEDYDMALGGGSYLSSRAGRYGALAVRTPARTNKDITLQVDPLPDLTNYDIAFVNLSGQYRNIDDKPQIVQLVTPLPIANFLQGPTSRTFTAAAKTLTPFKVPVLLTRAATNVTEAMGNLLRLPLQIKGPNGEVLAEGPLRLSTDFLTRPPATNQSLDGGTLELKVKNATGNPITLAFEMLPPPIVKVDQTKQSLTIAAGSDGRVTFPVPPQQFPMEGTVCRIPYRWMIGTGTPVDGNIVAELKRQTRWWVKRTVKTRPKFTDNIDTLSPGSDDIAGIKSTFSEAGNVFSLTAPSNGWKTISCGPSVTLQEAGPLPSVGSKVTGVTRVMVGSDMDALLDATAKGLVGFEAAKEAKEASAFLRVWFNGVLVFDSHTPKKERKPQSVRLRKGANTLVVEVESNAAGQSTAPDIAVTFTDTKAGTPITELILDMEKK